MEQKGAWHRFSDEGVILEVFSDICNAGYCSRDVTTAGSRVILYMRSAE